MTNGAFDLSRVRNRIIEHIELLPSEILDHPGQAWDHPESQARALAGILEEVGIVDEILVYRSERANGAYVTPDGHLRKSLDPRKPWPCTVLDLTDEEADYVLATKDPVGMMKKTNAEALDALLSSVSSANQAVQEMFADIAQRSGLYLDSSADLNTSYDVPESDNKDSKSYEFIFSKEQYEFVVDIVRKAISAGHGISDKNGHRDGNALFYLLNNLAEDVFI